MSYHLKNVFGEANILKIKFFIRNYKDILKEIEDRKKDDLNKAFPIGVYEFHISGKGIYSDTVFKHAMAMLNADNDSRWCEVAEHTVQYFNDQKDKYYDTHKDILKYRYQSDRTKKTFEAICQKNYMSKATCCRCEQDIILYAGMLAYEMGLLNK